MGWPSHMVWDRCGRRQPGKWYWALVDRHGFDPNLYNATGGAGNQRAMLYVNEGLMNTACSPTFSDVRDGILQAAMDNYGSEDVCLLWTAFAAFGLGADAISSGPSNTTPINGFGVPTICLGSDIPSLSAAGAIASEGDGSMVFNVSLSSPSSYPVQVRYATVDGTAVSTTHDTAYANDTAITIPAAATAVPATPYPSSIQVTSSPGPITKVQIGLHGFGHQLPQDVDVLLQGPGGQTAVLLSDAGGTVAVSGLTLTFSDSGQFVPAPLVSGTYRPTSNAPPESFPPPAPFGLHGSALSVFNGIDPVGVWNLYVIDDFPPTANGAISGGWSLILSTATGDFTVTSGTLTFAPGVTSQTVSVPITDDTVVESSESFQLILLNPLTRCSRCRRPRARFVDNDTPPPPSSPSDSVADFGERGLWIRFNDGETALWSQIHTVSPALIASGHLDGNSGDDFIAVFTGFGTWRWMNNAGWDQLHPNDASDVDTGDSNADGIDEVILNLPGQGIWICCTPGWRQLHTVTSAHLVVANIDGDAGGQADVVADFPGFGVWAWMNDSTWIQVHEVNVTGIQAGDFDGNGVDDLAMSFPGFGLYVRANNLWTFLTPLSPAVMTAGDIDGGGRDDSIASFPGLGVHAWKNNVGWIQLHAADVQVMASGDIDADGRADVALGFPGLGLWVWLNDTTFEQLHDATPEAIAVGHIDDAFR